MVIQKVSPVLYQSLGIFLPLITTNCAVLGLAVLNIQKDYTFLEGIVFAIGAALGFTLALVLFAGLLFKFQGQDHDLPRGQQDFHLYGTGPVCRFARTS